LNVRPLASNLIRNFALEIAVPSQQLNDVIHKCVIVLHHWIDLSPDDPRFIWSDAAVFHMPKPHEFASEDYAGNPIHILVFVFVLVAMGYYWRRFDRIVKLYALSLVCSFLLFCLVFKWWPWNARLHLPVLALAGPVVAVVFEAVLPGWVSSFAATLFL